MVCTSKLESIGHTQGIKQSVEAVLGEAWILDLLDKD